LENRKLTTKGLAVAAFDWDNTLACSRDALVYTVNQILPKYGLPLWNVVKERRDRNLSFRDNFPRIFGTNAESAYEDYRRAYKHNVKNLISKPDKSAETLSFLRAQGVKIVIVSNKDRNLLEYELPFLYDRSWFDNIVCGHEATADKPSPEQLRYAVSPFLKNISSQSVWMIGDSPMDSCCALQAGAKALRIGQPIWGTEKNEKSLGILFIENFSQLYDMLTER